MSDLRIIDVEGIYLKAPELRDRSDSSQDSLVVRITTNAGIVGYGEVDSCPSAAKAIIDAPTSHRRVRGLRDVLLGKDPLDTSTLWDLMYASTLYYGREGAVIHAMAGVDVALWDIKGKYLDQPIHRLMGGQFATQIRAYASHMFDMDPRISARRAAAAVEAGYQAVKFGFEPFGTDPDLDREFVEAIRSAIGDSVLLCIDAGMAWDARVAIDRCRRLEPYDLFWVEEPLHPDDLRGYRLLAAKTSATIAAGEKEGTVAGFLRLMDEGQVGVVQIDPSRVGLTQALHIGKLARQRGLPVANHNFATDINGAASLQMLAALPNALLFEYCAEPSVLRSAVTSTPISIIDGFAQVSEAPGLGIEVDLGRVAEFVVN